MVEQIELTEYAVVERLSQDTVPQRKVNDNIEYYVWVLKDEDLRSRLSEMYYGMFRDASDSLNSVTVKDYRDKGYWVFAPSVDIINWLIDANSIEDTLIDLQIYYGKLVDVESQLDEGLSPHLVFLRNNEKYISYDISNILRINTFIDTSIKNKQTEKEMIKAMALQEEDELEQNVNLVSEEEDEVEFVPEDEDVETLESFEEDDEEEIPEFEEPLPDFEEDLAAVETVSPAHKETTNFDDVSSSSFSADVNMSGLPDDIKSLINQIEVPLINESRLSVLNDEDKDFKAKIDDFRSGINEQLAMLTKASKVKLVRKYHDMYDSEAEKVQKLLDPKTGLPEVVDKYNEVEKLYQQNLADAQNIEDQKREELTSLLDSKHDEFIADAIEKAEAEWVQIKDDKFVEEPIREWRKDVNSKINDQHESLLDDIKVWTKQINDLKMKKINEPIVDTISREVRYAQDELQSEKIAARQDVNRMRDRLYDQMLMTRRLDDKRTMLEQSSLPQADVGMRNGSKKPTIDELDNDFGVDSGETGHEESEDEVIENEDIEPVADGQNEVDEINIEDIEADDISKDIAKLNRAPKKSLDEIVDNDDIDFNEKTVIESMNSDEDDDPLDLELPDEDLDENLDVDAVSDMDALDNLEKFKLGDLVEGEEDDDDFEEPETESSSDKKKKGFNLKSLLKKPSLKKKK